MPGKLHGLPKKVLKFSVIIAYCQNFVVVFLSPTAAEFSTLPILPKRARAIDAPHVPSFRHKLAAP